MRKFSAIDLMISTPDQNFNASIYLKLEELCYLLFVCTNNNKQDTSYALWRIFRIFIQSNPNNFGSNQTLGSNSTISELFHFASKLSQTAGCFGSWYDHLHTLSETNTDKGKLGSDGSDIDGIKLVRYFDKKMQTL